MTAYKLLGGSHDQGDGKVYQRGDIVYSEKDLDKQFGPRKFQRLEAPPVETPLPVSADDEFSDMTVAELKKFAEEEEIELGSASRKEDILSVIRNAVTSL